jgi:hypothetical protein
MELLGDVDHGKSCFSPFGEGVSVGAKIGAWFGPHRLSNRFGHTRWYSEVTRHKWNLILVLL